jgi:hypothetical protein
MELAAVPPTPTSRRALGWGAVAVLLVLQYALFRQFVTREIAWAYPAHHDQIVYLLQAYDTHEHVLDEGLRRGLAYGLHLPSPNGCLIHVEAALLFLLTGATRLGALTVNILHFVLFQVSLVAALRWLTRRWDVTLAGLGLLLAAVSPFLDSGGISDFRLDFAASCLMGVVLCLVVRCGIFTRPGWSLAAGGAGAWLVLFRFIAIVYLTGIGLALAAWFAWRWGRRRGLERAAEGRRLGNLALAVTLIAVTAVPVLWKRRELLKAYYVVGHVTGQEKGIRALKSGQRWSHSIQSLRDNHAGRDFLRLAGAGLALAAAYRVLRGRLPADPAARLDLRVALPTLALALLVPLAVLMLDGQGSPIVANVALPALLWLVLLAAVGCVGLHRRDALGSAPGPVLGVLGAIALLVGLHNQAWWYGHRTAFTTCRDDVDEALRLHDRIEACCAEHGWQRPIISATTNADFLHHQVSNVLMYERHGSCRQTLGLLGQAIMAMSRQDALAQAAASDVVVLARPCRVVYPFEQCMTDLYPQLRRLCREHFVRQDSYHIFGQDVTLYVRPALKVASGAKAWAGEEGLRLEGPPGALRGCKALQLEGAADFASLGGPPAVHAELCTPGRRPQRLPAVLDAEGGGYRLTIGCTGHVDVYDDPVEVRLTFDCSALPAAKGGDGDGRFIRAPHTIRTVR